MRDSIPAATIPTHHMASSSGVQTPKRFHGVMVSSTFEDLTEHREALIKALSGQGLHPIAMEHDAAKPDGDVVDRSLEMVREAAAYVAVIGKRYGQTPVCARRNPDRRSLTELEFLEARNMGRPILLFLMGSRYPVMDAFNEFEPEKRARLQAFREEAKSADPDGSVHRIYSEFNSFEEFALAATQGAADLRRLLEDPGVSPEPPRPIPEFLAEPPYIGSHEFVGRKPQLEALSAWAAPVNTSPVMIFEAIGGTGKSMLTWEWTTKHAPRVRPDWAGRFWYSFYEKGAVMEDFCRRALAYTTGQSMDALQKKKTAELGSELLRVLNGRPFLLVLDGLERILVAYHRLDASQLADEDAGRTDEIGSRDPCLAIRPEDDELLHLLAGAGPSKMLLTTRLVPLALLNKAKQPIQGVSRQLLPGLYPPEDAEAILRSGGVVGDSNAIQDYLKIHCDCHPLVTGVLAGLILDYLPDRGNFDAWAADPDGGAKLNLGELNLVQKRNHILASALDALGDSSRRLLSMLAMIPEAVDYETLIALNPHLPAAPEEPPAPVEPEQTWAWRFLGEDQRKAAHADFARAVKTRQEYEGKLRAWRASREVKDAPKLLAGTIQDLERRGLIQYDRQKKRYDLHPVIRGSVAGKLNAQDRQSLGQRVVDHFSQKSHRPYDQAKALEDLSVGLHIIRTLLQMGRMEQAYATYRELDNALCFNLEENSEELALLRPFFPSGWSQLPEDLPGHAGSYLANNAGWSLNRLGQYEEAIAAYGCALRSNLDHGFWSAARSNLSNIAVALYNQNKLRKQAEFLGKNLRLAASHGGREDLFRARLSLFLHQAETGQFEAAKATWAELDPMGRDWSVINYRPGEAECGLAQMRFWMGDLDEETLATAEQLAQAPESRGTRRKLHALRGEWRMEQGDWAGACASFQEAVRMSREIGLLDASSSAYLALARHHLGRLGHAEDELARLRPQRRPDPLAQAMLLLALGDRAGAEPLALEAHRHAWADGGRHIHWHALRQCESLLGSLNLAEPDLPPSPDSADQRFEWEASLDRALAGESPGPSPGTDDA